MIAQDLATRLEARHTTNGWEARCPAHEDHDASLSIAEGKNGCVLLKCHAGCDVNAICAALKIDLRDLFAPNPDAHRQPRKQGKIVATYDYTDAAGKLLYQVCRFEPKGFRQRRPDPNKPGAWAWNMDGQTRVLYRLPAVLKAKDEGRAIFLAEGEKDCDALAALGLTATCNTGGAGKWSSGYTESLTGAKVVILPDRDPAGHQHAALVLKALTGKSESCRVVELPDCDGHAVKDAADWIAAGGTLEELREIVLNAPTWTPHDETDPAPTDAKMQMNGKPCVILPEGPYSISSAGLNLGTLLARTNSFFLRGAAVVKLVQDQDAFPFLEDVKPATLASDFESVAVLVRMKGKEPKFVICTEQTAKLIASSSTFREALPPIHILTRCPVLIERAGNLIQVTGYDRVSGIFAGGKPAEPMDLAEARRLLTEVLDGFRFATPADRARALAAMITPALVFGGLLKGRTPVDLGEANASQTGKGYRNKLTAAIYSQNIKTVTQQRGGVGSMEESFNMALIRGANFIALDNVRGKIDSPSFESFLTEDTYHARAPYREPVEIDPRRIVIMMTSNKADVTTDLANRASCVRLLKQAEGYTFKSYPEGDILEHVRANQPRYLGAVFAIVQAWAAAGRPKTTETRHDFRPWAQTLDWITRNLLNAGPLLDGHRETQARMTNPVLNWLRDVAIDVIRAKQTGAWLRAGDLVDLLAETGTETPGLPELADLTDPETRKSAQQATGRRMGLCFRASDTVNLDGMTIERREIEDFERRKSTREYRFSTAPDDGHLLGANPATRTGRKPETCSEQTPETTETGECAYCTPGAAPDDAPDKSLIAPDAPDTSQHWENSNTVTHDEGKNIVSMETIRRIGAKSPTESSTGFEFYEYHERAGILEYDARLPRPEAEVRGATMLEDGTPITTS